MLKVIYRMFYCRFAHVCQRIVIESSSLKGAVSPIFSITVKSQKTQCIAGSGNPVANGQDANGLSFLKLLADFLKFLLVSQIKSIKKKKKN